MKKSRFHFWAVIFILSIVLCARESNADSGAKFSVSPDSGAALLLPLLEGAKKSIYLNVYILTNKEVVQKLINKAAQGVSVTVLLEGDPVPNFSASSREVADSLSQGFADRGHGNGKILVMTGNHRQIQRRFVYDHAKYVVVDDESIVISSENITTHAFPSTQTSSGSRGWQVLLENPTLASTLKNIFLSDTDPSNADIVSYETFSARQVPTGNAVAEAVAATDRTVDVFPMGTGTVTNAELCMSPRSLQCMLDFIRSAQKTLVMEHLSMPLHWTHDPGEEKEGGVINPILQEIVAAANRGVHVKFLVNNEKSFGGGKNNGGSDTGETGDIPRSFLPIGNILESFFAPLGRKPGEDTFSKEKNIDTINWLKSTATEKGLAIEANLFDAKALQVSYVHNKGMVADGTRVFVSSINGTENSVMRNREMAVAIDSADAGKYYGAVFEYDWLKSNH